MLGYVTPPDRALFAGVAAELAAVWLSNEGTGVLPGISVPVLDASQFVLVAGGRSPLAITDSHGTWLHWLAG